MDRIRALRLSLTPHRVALAAVGGRFRPELRHGGRGSPLRLVTLPRRDRPPGWVRIAPTLAGICGSDRHLLEITDLARSPLTAFYGTPRGGIVPGHEIVGRVVEADPDAGVAVGDRVVAEPTLGCQHKGYDPCGRCRAGDDHRCGHLADAGTLSSGHGFGFGARYGGGWAEELVAPADRVHRVPDDLDDRVAVLAEPTAVGVHAVLRDPPVEGDRVAVVGPGPIGLTLVLALRALAPGAEVTVIGRDPRTAEVAQRVGAARHLTGAGGRLVSQVADLLGTDLRRSSIAGTLAEDGFDQVYDTVGSAATLDAAFRVTRPGGTVVLVAASTRQAVDWSLVWFRELTIRGTSHYGVETVPADATVPGGRRRAMPVALDVLGAARPGHLVTHVFPLEEAPAALAASAAGDARGAVKVCFTLEP